MISKKGSFPINGERYHLAEAPQLKWKRKVYFTCFENKFSTTSTFISQPKTTSNSNLSMWFFRRRNGHHILQSIYANTISLKTLWGVQLYYSVSQFIHIKWYLALQTTNRYTKLLSENTLLALAMLKQWLSR